MGNTNQLQNLSDVVIVDKPKGCCDQFSLFISQGKSDPSDITCSICFRIFANPRIMKCKHKYCEDCISTWGKGPATSCPFCRIELKRQRGTFGRMDKKTQKNIEKIALKCRNCCWEGSPFMFFSSFGVQPFLDDSELPIDNGDSNENEILGQQIKEQKEETLQLERTKTKPKEEDNIKQETLEKQLKPLLDEKQARLAMNLFAGTLLQLVQSGQLDIGHFL